MLIPAIAAEDVDRNLPATAAEDVAHTGAADDPLLAKTPRIPPILDR